MFCVSQQFLYIRLTVPEEKNNNDDRHIKKRQNKSYCQFFFLPFLSLSLSPFLLFRVVAHKKNRGEKEERSNKPQTNIIIGDIAIREALTILLRDQITYLYFIYIISAASSLLSSKFYYFNSLLLYFLSILYYNYYQSVDNILPISLVSS